MGQVGWERGFSWTGAPDGGFRVNVKTDSGVKTNRIPGGRRTVFARPQHGFRDGPERLPEAERHWTSQPAQ
jgi:hypothetical protein